jgi:predicted ATP-dependent serine protease
MDKSNNWFKSFEQFLSEAKSDRVISAKDLLETDFEDYLEFDGKWEQMFGKPAPDMSMMLSGAPASGKTSILLEFSYYIASKFGKLIYISSEEFGSVTLVQKLEEIVKKSGMKSEDNEGKFLLPDNLYFAKGMTDLEDYDFVVIDSVNDLNLDLMDYKEIRDIYPKKAFISVLQYTKSGDFRGGLDWEHEMDISAKIEAGVVTVKKNRYGENSKYDYFNDEPLDYDNDEENED